MRLSELSLITAGTLYGDDTEFYSVSIDTRSLKPGDLFIAINGPRFDGHDFVNHAEKLGACGVMVEQRQDSPLPQILVSDARIALGKLGAAWRGKCPAQVVGLTGSNGKTTVK